MYICSLSLSFNVPSFRAFFESLDVKKNKAAALFASGSRRGGGASRRRYNLERVLFKGCVVSHFDDTLIKMTSLFFPIKFFSSFSTTIVLEAFYASFRFLSWGKKVGRKNSNFFFFYPHFSTKKRTRGVKILHVSITHVDVVVELCQTLGNDRKDLPRSGKEER